MGYENIIVVKGPSAVISLNRPRQMNALDKKTLQELKAAVEELEQDRSVVAVLLTAEGDRAFCAGADLKERSSLSVPETKEVRRLLVDCFSKISRFTKPAVAAVNGPALGGGFELAMCCDFIIASENAVFGLPEVGLAIIPGGGGTVNLPRMVGINKAKELIFTGRRIDAREAYEIGLVSRIFPAEGFYEKSLEFMEEIAKNGPVALQQAKKSVNLGSALDINTAFELEAECYNTCLNTEDRKEGLKAFMEKRRPVYMGY
ncbi:MAG: enoyl-CoA hydratase-related protein [Peptococcaceae bacterium]|jgi:enoyl-CoA hydratase/carnithine racemase|nr:enoyl-CoA hydratase-related protein [Peptococcaceae bacterium]MDH7524645.1 enoyl-CoA hydratase-related protein [Peptococcaceae bacterium]